jgi:hypothetical protein
MTILQAIESPRLPPYVLKLIAVFPKALRTVVFSLENNDQQLTLELSEQKDILSVLSFLKNHTGTLFLSIAELTAVD